MKKRMLYLRKTPVQSAFIIYLLALGLILFPTQWLGDLFFAEEKMAVLFGLGGMRVVMGAVMALIAVHTGFSASFLPRAFSKRSPSAASYSRSFCKRRVLPSRDGLSRS